VGEGSDLEWSKDMILKIKLSLLFLIAGLFATHGVAQQQKPTSLVGTYHTGHRFGSSALTLNADGSYVMNSSDCTMEYVQSGTYVSSSGVLHFKILTYVTNRGDRKINLLNPYGRLEVFGSYSDKISTEFELLPITWSDRIYLIDEDEVSSFANAVNFGLEPRSQLGSEPYYGSFYLREGDQKKKVSGAPGIPDKWSSLLLRQPVVATIVTLKGDGKGTLATLNKGSKSGLRVGMQLLARDEEPSPWSGAKVVSVTQNSAVIRTSGEITVGDKLSTKHVSRRLIYE
jgi:hypothetical protein